MTESPVATSSAARPNLPEYTVGELSALLKRTVEQNFSYVRVRGEISGFKRHSSGHSYFALKDADALLDAVSWRGTRLTIKPEDGMEVVCTGRLTTYPARSRYQLVVESMELAGIGALLKLLEERKARLAAEGLFAEARKKPLPYLPDIIGIVTSPTGAVIRDILHRLADRFPRYVLIWPVAVQGEGAGSQVAAAIEGFNRLLPQGTPPRPDLLIVARGGGSLEDLMAFNEEIVVRAAAASAIPLISAVGHETDTTLIDFASDKRAPTPSAAAEMAVPVRLELRAELVGWIRRVRPEVVLGHDPTAVFFGQHYFNHHDHREVGWALLDALSPASALPHYFPERGPAHQVSVAYLSGTLEPDVWVDVTETIDVKVAAVGCHRSQLPELGSWADDVVRGRAAEEGARAGVPYAEGFRRLHIGP